MYNYIPMSKQNYEHLQSRFTELMNKYPIKHRYYTRKERESYEEAVLACKSLLKALINTELWNKYSEPIRHGRWIKNEDRSGWHCSCCGKDDLYAYPYTENNERELQDFYCPNCGAKMDEVEE